MSKIISALDIMASDAAIEGENAIADLVASIELTDNQKEAIIASDTQALIEATDNISEIQSIFLVPSEDDEEPIKENEEEEKTDTNNTLAIAING